MHEYLTTIVSLGLECGSPFTSVTCVQHANEPLLTIKNDEQKKEVFLRIC